MKHVPTRSVSRISTITPTPMTARQPMVLVADDEAAIQAIVTRVIVQLGLVALSVGDGAAAIQAVAARRADLICAVLDIAMPIVNGVDAAHVIQRLEPDLAIVLSGGAAANQRDVQCCTRIAARNNI